MTLDWLKPAKRLASLPPYVFARLDELKANARAEGVDEVDVDGDAWVAGRGERRGDRVPGTRALRWRSTSSADRRRRRG